MKDTIEQILNVIPHDYVVLCPCGAALSMDDIHRCLIKCYKCGQDHNFHSLEMVTLSEYIEKSLKKLDIDK